MSWPESEILVIIIASGLLLFAYHYGKQQKFNVSILLIILAGLVLRLYTSLDLFLHAWDERFHALIAKNLISHPLVPTLYENPILGYDYKNWTANYVWLYKPPFALWCIALSLRVFGFHEIAVRIPSLIFSSLSILLTYQIGRLVFHEKAGLLAAFFHSINGFLIDLASGRTPTDHIDTAFIFFVELGVFLSLCYANRRNNVLLPLIGISTGVAVLTRYLPGLIVVLVWLSFNWKSEPWKVLFYKSLQILFVAGLVFLPWNFYVHAQFPEEAAWVQRVNISHLDTAVDEHRGSILYHWLRIPRYFGLLSYIPICLYVWLCAKRRESGLYGILVWFVIPYLFFSLVETKLPGYTMISAPAIFLILSYGWWYLRERKGLTVKLILLLLILFPIVYSLERLKIFSYYERNPDWSREIRALRDKIGINDGRVVVFNTQHPIETMFYTPYIAYSFFPDARQEKYLLEKGFMVAILNGKELSINRPGDEGEFVSQSVPPPPWRCGETYIVSITMKNAGTTSWQATEPFGPHYFLTFVSRNNRLCPVSPAEWRSMKVLMPSNEPVLPGQLRTFTFQIRAPSTPGSYHFRWQMRKTTRSGWASKFGASTPALCIPVQ